MVSRRSRLSVFVALFAVVGPVHARSNSLRALDGIDEIANRELRLIGDDDRLGSFDASRFASAGGITFKDNAAKLASCLTVLHWYATQFKKISVPFWVDFGTLLGATRNESVIPWDTDMDGASRPVNAPSPTCPLSRCVYAALFFSTKSASQVVSFRPLVVSSNHTPHMAASPAVPASSLDANTKWGSRSNMYLRCLSSSRSLLPK